MIFPKADLLFALHEVEQQLLKLGQGVLDENKYTQLDSFKCREMGRAHGFFAAAHIVTEKIDKLAR